MRRISELFMLVIAAALLVVPAARSASSDMVVSQVYAGGGNANAPYTNDFVELFNRGAATVDLSTWSIQYATASGTTWQVTPLSGSVPAGGHYLDPACLCGGDRRFVADARRERGQQPRGLGRQGRARALDDRAHLRRVRRQLLRRRVVVDLAGYGAATDYEGGAAAPALDNTTADVRAGAGCTETDSNSSDFAAAAPAPRNSAAAAAPCSTGSPSPPTASQSATVDLDMQSVLSIALERPSISFGSASPGETPAPVSERVTVSSNHPAGYALTVHRSAFVPSDLPLGLSAVAPSGGQLGSGLGGGAMAAIPIGPAPDLLIGTTSAPTAAGGDVWERRRVVSPLPVVAPGHYTATVTFTAIGR